MSGASAVTSTFSVWPATDIRKGTAVVDSTLTLALWDWALNPLRAALTS